MRVVPSASPPPALSPAAAFEHFIYQWRSTGAPSADDASSEFELRTAPRASFRPHEIVPRVYLGGIRDVANTAELMRELSKESERRRVIESAPHPPQQPTQPQTKQPASSADAETSPRSHRLFLLISVCHEITQAVPLAVTTPTPTTSQPVFNVEGGEAAQHRTETCAHAAQLELRRVLTPQATQTRSATTSATAAKGKAHPVRSELITAYKLTDLEARARGEGRAREVQWWTDFLTHHYNTHVWSPKPTSEALADTTPASQPSSFAASTPRQGDVYWRLLLPLEDSPDVALHDFFHIVSVIARAALDAPVAFPAKVAPAAAQSGQRPVVSHSGGHMSGGAVRPPPCAASPAPLPCLVFHCMAGRSRSAALVMSFLLDEWRRVSLDGGHDQEAADVAVRTEGRVVPKAETHNTRHREDAEVAVRLLLRFVQERRPIVSPNDGFYKALEDAAEAIIAAIVAPVSPRAHADMR